METFGKNGRQCTSGNRPLLNTVVAIAIAVIAILQGSGTQAQVTGTISRTEPPATQDGTPAHPYSDASHCPARTDVVFWSNGRSVPNIPPSISVCFVGNAPFENSGPDPIEVRERK